MRATETKLPVLDSGPYPLGVQTDHEIWRSLPKDIRDASIETISALERKLAGQPTDSPEEKEFHNELRAALVVAIGVLQEAGAGRPLPAAGTTTPNRMGNA